MSMKRRVINKKFVPTPEPAQKEYKSRTKNRFPVKVPTPGELFKIDIEWQRKANPGAFKQQETFKKLDQTKLKKQKELKRIHESRDFDYMSLT